MKLGVYFDLRNPTRWKRDPTELYLSTISLCEEADELGLDSVWFTEHHQFDDGYLTQPLTMAAAVASRTQRVRLGIGIAIAPLHSPVDLAEQAAVVDILSGGRLELGLGAGYRAPEFELFGADFSRRYQTTIATVHELRRLWNDNVLSPKPVQDRIPLWLGFQGPVGAHRAGVAGEGLLSAYGPNVEPYQRGLAEAGHPASTGVMGGLVQAWVSDDPDVDWAQISPHLAYQVDSYREHGVRGTDRRLPRPVDPDRMRARAPDGFGNYFLFGSPEDVGRQIIEYVGDAPVETVFLWGSLPGMSKPIASRHIELLATRLAPVLARHGRSSDVA